MNKIKKIYKKYIKNKKIKKKLIIPNFLKLDKITKKLKIKKEDICKTLKLFNFKVKDILKNEIIILITEYLNKEIFKSNITKKSFKNNKNLFINFLGHVDSGKTTIIKNILKKNIKEFRNITQNINFYKYKKMYLIDTPGHEDFNVFRNISLQITNLIVLIISVRDKFNKNLKEIIKYINNNQIPLVVILNKIDIKNIKYKNFIKFLINNKLFSKKKFKNIFFVKNKFNSIKHIKNIINNLLIFHQIINNKTNKNKFFIGVAVEKKNFKKLGLLTTVLIKSGKLKSSEILLVNNNFYKIKFLFNDKNKLIKNSNKNSLIKLTGISNLVDLGQKFNKIKNLKLIKNLLISRKKKKILINKDQNEKIKYEIMNNLQKKNVINLILIIENDAMLKVIKKNLKKISDKNFKIKIVDFSLLNLNLNLIKKAVNLKCYIINFNMKIKKNLFKNIKHLKLKIKNFFNIYQIENYLNSIKNLILKKKKVIGLLFIKQIFKIKNKTIAGCKVVNGLIKINSRIKLFRDNLLIHEGYIESLNYMKKMVTKVEKFNECGIILKLFHNVMEEDVLKVYEN